jgi:hypothetical protein
MTDRPTPDPEPPPAADADAAGQPSAVPDELEAQPTGDDAAKPAAGDDDGEPDGRAY